MRSGWRSRASGNLAAQDRRIGPPRLEQEGSHLRPGVGRQRLHGRQPDLARGVPGQQPRQDRPCGLPGNVCQQLHRRQPLGQFPFRIGGHGGGAGQQRRSWRRPPCGWIRAAFSGSSPGGRRAAPYHRPDPPVPPSARGCSPCRPVPARRAARRRPPPRSAGPPPEPSTRRSSASRPGVRRAVNPCSGFSSTASSAARPGTAVATAVRVQWSSAPARAIFASGVNVLASGHSPSERAT